MEHPWEVEDVAQLDGELLEIGALGRARRMLAVVFLDERLGCMASLPQEDAWLIETSVYKVLGLGEDTIEFALRLRDLHVNNDGRFHRLIGICNRLEFVEQIHLATRIFVSRERGFKVTYEMERLITYLTTTCIDVATGESFQTYEAWLQRSFKSGTLDADTWNSAMQDLSRAELDEIPGLFVDLSTRIYRECYEHNQSIRKAFKHFVQDIDDSIKDWLFDDYFIQFGTSLLDIREPLWESLDSLEKAERIAYYLYDLRNRYTHTVAQFHPLNLQERIFGISDDSMDGYVSTIFTQSKRPKNRIVFLRTGLYESDVIQFLIVIWLRKNWLDITDDQSMLQKFWDRVTYRRLGFCFLAELEVNQRLIENWCAYPLSPFTQELSLDDFQLPYLYRLCAEKFLEKHRQVLHLDISTCNVNTYLRLIDVINLRINEYNVKHASLDHNTRPNEVKNLFTELTNLSEMQRLYSCIENLNRDLIQRLESPSS